MTQARVDRYAVIGHPVAHSLSPQIHEAFARQTEQQLAYRSLASPIDDFVATLGRFFEGGGRGVNVTLPFKEAAYQWVTQHDPYAAAAGAVNTITPVDDGFIGCNTDGLGLIRDLVGNQRVALQGRRVLVIGAGGAVRGVLGPLLGADPARLVIANRTLARGEMLCERLEDPRTEAVSLDCLADQDAFDVLINGTSAGLDGLLPDIPAALFEGAAVYDMVYGSGAKAFLDHAGRCGAVSTVDGLGMLVEQAAEAFLLWRGLRPDTAPVLAALRDSAR